MPPRARRAVPGSRQPRPPAAARIPPLPEAEWTAEQRALVEQTESNLLTAIAASNPNQPLRYSTIIDVSTAEGQQMIEAINGDLAAAAYGSSQFFPEVINLTR